MLLRLVIVALLILVFWLGTRKMQLVPGRFQGTVEMGLDLVRVNIARICSARRTAVASSRS